jgi:hypothetical protein
MNHSSSNSGWRTRALVRGAAATSGGSTAAFVAGTSPALVPLPVTVCDEPIQLLCKGRSNVAEDQGIVILRGLVSNNSGIRPARRSKLVFQH